MYMHTYQSVLNRIVTSCHDTYMVSTSIMMIMMCIRV